MPRRHLDYTPEEFESSRPYQIARQKLPRRQFEVWCYTHHPGYDWSLQHIADFLYLSVRTVRRDLAAARRRIRDGLAGEGVFSITVRRHNGTVVTLPDTTAAGGVSRLSRQERQDLPTLPDRADKKASVSPVRAH